MRETKYLKNSVWVFPPNPNMLKEEPTAYNTLHCYIRNNLPKPAGGLCEECHNRLATEVSNKDGQYSGSLNTWEWSCRSCNMSNGLTITKLSLSHLGKTHSPETRAKMSTAALGKPKSAEHKAKMSASWNRIFTPETRAKMSVAKKGKKLSIEHRQKMSIAKLFYYQNTKHLGV